MTSVVVLQPSYMPWLGYFDQMDRADVFVFYDVVQYDKNGWRNRNRIKTRQGAQWITVPVLQSKRHDQTNLEVEIDTRGDWAAKHTSSLEQAYAHARHVDDYLPEIASVLHQPWTKLVDLNVRLTQTICGWLDIATECHRCSELDVAGDRNERLLNICRRFGADRYISGDSAKDYLDEDAFRRSGIEVEWQDYRHPRYEQLHGEFLPNLSVIDLLFNCGGESLAIIRTGRPTTGA